MIERLTKKQKVKLVDGTEVEILLYTTIGFRKAQQIRELFFDGMKVNKKQADNDEIDIDVNVTQRLASKLVEEHWADKNYTLDDVDDESLSALAVEMMSYFLKRVGVRTET